MIKEEKKIAKKAYKLLDNSILYSPRPPLRVELNFEEKRKELESIESTKIRPINRRDTE